jgi:hypothetical protein
MTARVRLRAVAGLAGVAAIAATARADAPSDQYGLFNMTVETIQDLRTSLVWQRLRNTVPPLSTFAGAAAYCKALALPSSATGWRVPSYKELLTIVDESPHLEYENGNLVSKAIDRSAFLGTLTDFPYWTSSLYAKDRTYAYVVNFRDGRPASQTLAQTAYVRCVYDVP